MSVKPPAHALWTRRLALLTHLGFALTGVVTTLLGPLLPTLVARWRLTDAQAGTLFSAEFAGSIVGVAASPMLLRRWGLVGTILSGLALCASGVAALSATGFAAGLAAVFVFGFGLGLTGPGFNLWIAAAQAERRAEALSVLNMAWAIGATAAPAALAWLTRRGWLTAFLPGLALLLLAVGLLLALEARGRGVAPVAPRAQRLPARFWASGRVLLFASVFFVYVGIENALGGWAAMSAERVAAPGSALPAAVPAFFWGALVLGRGLAPLALRRHDEAGVGLAALGLATAGILGLLTARSALGVSAAVAVAGLGLAPVFPLTVALLSRAFGPRAANVTGPLFGVGACGGALVPWLVGVVSTRRGDLEAGLAVTLLGALALIALYRVIRGLSRAEAPAETP